MSFGKWLSILTQNKMPNILVTNNGNNAMVLYNVWHTFTPYLKSETDGLKQIKDLNSLVRDFPLISWPEAWVDNDRKMSCNKHWKAMIPFCSAMMVCWPLCDMWCVTHEQTKDTVTPGHKQISIPLSDLEIPPKSHFKISAGNLSPEIPFRQRFFSGWIICTK